MIVGLLGQAGSGKDTVADFMVKHHGFVKVAFADPLKRICQDVFGFTDEQLWGPSEKRNAPDPRWPRGAERYREAAESAFKNGKARAELVGEDWKSDAAVQEYFIDALEYACEGWLTPRHALQQLGSEWGRSCSPDVWVRYALSVHRRLQNGDGIYDFRRGFSTVSFVGDAPDAWVRAKKDIVISDVRFRNETVLLQQAGAKVTRIVRKERPDTKPTARLILGELPETLAELMQTSFLLPRSAAGHISETEQKELPDELFDHHLINGGNSLDLLEAAVVGLVQTIRG